MKQNFIFIFILLAMLSMVNAIPAKLHKRITAFKPCPKTPLDVTRITPDPLVSGAKAKFYISGAVAKTIPNDYVLAILYMDISVDPPELIDYSVALICEPDGVLECPYKAKTPFAVIYTVYVPSLPKSYGIVVALGDQTLDTVIGCATAVVGGGSPKYPEPATIFSSINTKLSINSPMTN
jgi:hypothetical protein